MNGDEEETLDIYGRRDHSGHEGHGLRQGLIERMLGLTLVILAILIVSTVLFAALVTISVAYISLVATHFVLPAADRSRADQPYPYRADTP